jgi:hypothetical protein
MPIRATLTSGSTLCSDSACSSGKILKAVVAAISTISGAGTFSRSVSLFDSNATSGVVATANAASANA